MLSEDDSMFMVLTAAGVGSDFLPKHYLLNVASSNWSVQRVVAEGTACFWGAGDHNVSELPEDWKCLYRMQVRMGVVLACCLHPLPPGAKILFLICTSAQVC